MTKSTITREENIQAVFDLKAGYTLGIADVEILKRVARMALAAMDSEPVAEVCEDYAIRYISSGPAPKEGLHPGDKLYRHAQPAPVVPDDYQHLKNVRELYHKQEDRLFALAQRISGESFDKYSHVPSQAIDVLERTIFGDEGDACRAAMLQAGTLTNEDTKKAGNSPVNDVTNGKPLTIILPDITSKAFWSCTGKTEIFHPETYCRWVKEAIERYCAIARIDVEVK